MLSARCRWAAAIVLPVLLAVQAQAADAPAAKKGTKAEVVALPAPTEVQALAAYPPSIALRGGDDSIQLVLTANLPGGRVQDLTGDVKYEIANNAIVRIAPSGRVI